jgi:hypothetical protein
MYSRTGCETRDTRTIHNNAHLSTNSCVGRGCSRIARASLARAGFWCLIVLLAVVLETRYVGADCSFRTTPMTSASIRTGLSSAGRRRWTGRRHWKAVWRAGHDVAYEVAASQELTLSRTCASPERFLGELQELAGRRRAAPGICARGDGRNRQAPAGRARGPHLQARDFAAHRAQPFLDREASSSRGQSRSALTRRIITPRGVPGGRLRGQRRALPGS